MLRAISNLFSFFYTPQNGWENSGGAIGLGVIFARVSSATLADVQTNRSKRTTTAQPIKIAHQALDGLFLDWIDLPLYAYTQIFIT